MIRIVTRRPQSSQQKNYEKVGLLARFLDISNCNASYKNACSHSTHIKSAWNQSKGSPSNKTTCLYLLENPSYLTTFYRVRILTWNYSVTKTQHQKGLCCISCWKDKLLKTSHMVNTTITTVMGLHPLLSPTGQSEWWMSLKPIDKQAWATSFKVSMSASHNRQL
jgi:hypothetical protein